MSDAIEDINRQIEELMQQRRRLSGVQNPGNSAPDSSHDRSNLKPSKSASKYKKRASPHGQQMSKPGETFLRSYCIPCMPVITFEHLNVYSYRFEGETHVPEKETGPPAKEGF